MNFGLNHSCSTCDTCLSCHKCLQYRASTFRGNSSESEEEIKELFVSSADTHFKDDDPQYIMVGPDNEKISTTPNGTTLSVDVADDIIDDDIIDDDIIDDDISSDDQQSGFKLPSWMDNDSDIDDPTWHEGASKVEDVPVNSWSEDSSVKDRSKVGDDPSWVQRPSVKKPKIIKRQVVKKRPKRASWINKLQRIQAGLDVEESSKAALSSDSEEDADDPQSFDCQICNKAFSSKKDLKIHQIYHSTEASHECKLCGMQFEYSYELIKHSINHRNPNNICEYCKREFKTAEKWRVHMASHTGEFPYFCVICNKGFKDYTRLKSHLTCHTDDKPFVCEHCGKGFRRKSQLKTHSWVHSEIKPYACEICEKPFNYKCNLQLHLQRCHNIFDD